MRPYFSLQFMSGGGVGPLAKHEAYAKSDEECH